MNCNLICATMRFSLAIAAATPPGRAAEPNDSATRPTGAEAYYREVLRILDAVESQAGDLVGSASAAAERYDRDESLRLGVDGAECFVREVVYRSGGLMHARRRRWQRFFWIGIN